MINFPRQNWTDYRGKVTRFIQTQSFVSRKHMEIFGFYFPEEIKNWYCDDWMTFTYYPDSYYFISFFCKNMGGSPRYKVVGSLNPNDPVRKKCFELVSKHRSKIIDFTASSLSPSSPNQRK